MSNYLYQLIIFPTKSNKVIGKFSHTSEQNGVYKCCLKNETPASGAFAFNKDKKLIGKITEVLGQIYDVWFSVKFEEGYSFEQVDIYAEKHRIKPVDTFKTPDPKNPLLPKV